MTRAIQNIIYTAGPYAASHGLARKNAKFTMKLSATHHATLERCGESRRSRDLELQLIYNVQCLQINRFEDMLVISLHDSETPSQGNYWL